MYSYLRYLRPVLDIVAAELHRHDHTNTSELAMITELTKLLDEGKHLKEIAPILGLTYKQLCNELRDLVGESTLKDLQKRDTARRRKSRHPLGEHTNRRGQIMVPRPSWYTGNIKGVHVAKSHTILLPHLGLTEVPPGHIIVHLDGDKTNFDLVNLWLTTRSEYQTYLRNQKENSK